MRYGGPGKARTGAGNARQRAVIWCAFPMVPRTRGKPWFWGIPDGMGIHTHARQKPRQSGGIMEKRKVVSRLFLALLGCGMGASYSQPLTLQAGVQIPAG